MRKFGIILKPVTKFYLQFREHFPQGFDDWPWGTPGGIEADFNKALVFIFDSRVAGVPFGSPMIAAPVIPVIATDFFKPGFFLISKQALGLVSLIPIGDTVILVPGRDLPAVNRTRTGYGIFQDVRHRDNFMKVNDFIIAFDKSQQFSDFFTCSLDDKLVCRPVRHNSLLNIVGGRTTRPRLRRTKGRQHKRCGS